MSGDKRNLDTMIFTMQDDIDVSLTLVKDINRRIHLVNDPKDVHLLPVIRYELDTIRTV
jgi:hypothetical protein